LYYCTTEQRLTCPPPQQNNLRYLATRTELPLVQLTGGLTSVFWDTKVSVAQAMTPAGLAEIAKYAAGVGCFKEVLRSSSSVGLPANQVGSSTGIAARIHAAGMQARPLCARDSQTLASPDARICADSPVHVPQRGPLPGRHLRHRHLLRV